MTSQCIEGYGRLSHRNLIGHMPFFGLKTTRAHLSATVLSGAMFVTACAGVPNPSPPRTILAPQFEARVEGEVASLDQWWLLYEDQQLAEVVEAALARNPTIDEALARVAEARALRGARLSRFGLQGNPQASVDRRDTSVDDAKGSTTDIAGSLDTTSADFQVSWEIDLFGRGLATRRASDAEVSAAGFAADGAKASLAAETADSLFTARAITAQLEAAREAERLQADLVRIVGRRVERGLAARSDLARVSAESAQATARTRGLEAERQAAVRSLLTLTGDVTSPTTSQTITAELSEPPLVPGSVPSDLLFRRPDVREAEARLTSAVSTLDLSRRELLPSLTLRPGVGWSRQQGSVDATTSYWSIGAGLAVPLFDRPRLLAEAQASGARAEGAVAAYERVLQTAFSEADRTLVLLEADRSVVTALAKGEEEARFAYSAALRRYGAGLDDLQAVLDAESAWRSVRANLIDARAQTLRRSTLAFRALGGGWAPTLQQ